MERSRRSTFYKTNGTTTQNLKLSGIKYRRKTGDVVLTCTYVPSVDSSFSTTRVRQRLCDLMGTDVIRLNDRRYFQQLSERLRDEYETIMDKKEEARAASEHARLRRLMLEGKIEDPYDYRTIVFGHKKMEPKKKKKRKITRHNSAQETHEEKYDNEDSSMSRTEDTLTQMNIMSGSSTSTSNILSDHGDQGLSVSRHSKPLLPNTDTDDNEKKQITNNSNEMHVQPRHHKHAALRPLSVSCSNGDSRRVQSAAPWLNRRETDSSLSNESTYDSMSLPDKSYIHKPSKYFKQEPIRMVKLRNEETVSGLYSIAEELVYPCWTYDKNCQMKKQ